MMIAVAVAAIIIAMRALNEWVNECDVLPVSYVDNDLLEETRYMYGIPFHSIHLYLCFAERFHL